MAHLTILNGPNHGRIIGLNPGQTYRIGRDPTLELCVDDAKASRVHVEIDAREDGCLLRDLRSKNGTLVNSQTITSHELKEGDEITIGETRLGFSMQEAPKSHLRGRHDSVLASRLPMGAVPTTSRTGEGGDSFETLELDAPLPLLRLEGTQVGDPALAPTVPIVRETPAALERSNRALRALYSIARACAESTVVKQLLTVLAERLQVALEADRVTPILIDEAGRWHVAELDLQKAESGKRPPVFSRVPVSRTIVDYAMRTRRSVLTTPRSDSRFVGSKSIGEQGISSAMCVPILSGDKIHGLIYADRLGGQDFDREDQELLTAACLQAAPALSGLRRLEDALVRKERLLEELKGQYNLIGECDHMKQVYSFIERAAPTDSVVLVLGESGTGKELVARAIHYNSPRREGPLVVVNCAALSETLIESELFGHAKGAFTGATADRKGRFELAHEGTIFLDEIGELSAACQTKLLRVLENGEVSRVGEARVRKVDVRLVAATNRDLAAESKAGRFREDLYYRLNVLTVNLPPLRDRGEDIRLLAEHYLHDASVRSGRHKLRFSDEAVAQMSNYAWPGNVRELRNLTERLAVLCPHEIIGMRDLPVEFSRVPVSAAGGEDDPDETVAIASPARKPAAPDTARSLADIEKDHILGVLEANRGNKKATAEVLGIDRSTLYAKLRAYGILSSS